jgi:hypothetical protein
MFFLMSEMFWGRVMGGFRLRLGNGLCLYAIIAVMDEGGFYYFAFYGCHAILTM